MSNFILNHFARCDTDQPDIEPELASMSTFEISTKPVILRCTDRDFRVTSIASFSSNALEATLRFKDAIASLPIDTRLEVRVFQVDDVTTNMSEDLPEDDLPNDQAASE